jgi:hypothetical protein
MVTFLVGPRSPGMNFDFSTLLGLFEASVEAGAGSTISLFTAEAKHIANAQNRAAIARLDDGP